MTSKNIIHHPELVADDLALMEGLRTEPMHHWVFNTGAARLLLDVRSKDVADYAFVGTSRRPVALALVRTEK